MDQYRDIFVFIACFVVIALASNQLGRFFVKARLPLISGFLFTGIIAGPSVLGMIPAGAVGHLRFVDETSLAFIAFAAGSELYLRELTGRFRSIAWVTIGLVASTFTLGGLTLFLLADYIPFMQDMPATHRIAISALGGVILVARSPASAIAVMKELRAKGPFTQTALGVTVIMDAVVIALFAVNSSVADALLANVGFDLSFVLLLLIEFAVSLAIAFALSKLLQLVLSRRTHRLAKTGVILAAGYGVFILSAKIRTFSHDHLDVEVLLEPLLICMAASVLVTNYSRYRTEFLTILHNAGPPIYIAFFTLTGASLELDVLAKTWTIALALFFVRLAAIFIGSFSGGAPGRRSAETESNQLDVLCHAGGRGPGARERSGRGVSRVGNRTRHDYHLGGCAEPNRRSASFQTCDHDGGRGPFPFGGSEIRGGAQRDDLWR